MRSAVSPPAGTIPASVDQHSATAVALAGTRALLALDTTVDAGSNATARRQQVWLTPAFAKQVQSAIPIAAPGAVWTSWAHHRAHLTVRTALGGDDLPPSKAGTAYRQVLATLTPTGRDGWHGSPQQRVEFVSLARIAGGVWRIAAMNESSSQ